VREAQAGAKLDYFIPERLSYSIPPPEVAAVAGDICWCGHGTGRAHVRNALTRFGIATEPRPVSIQGGTLVS
jgi:hypothetical protein